MSNNFYRNNSRLIRADRAGGFDRYGQPLNNAVTVSTGAPIRLEERKSEVVGADGRTATIDGTMMVGKSVELREGDRLKMKDNSEWVVFDVDDSLDINGRVLFRTYGLTKQRTNA